MQFPQNPPTGATFTAHDTTWKFNGSDWDRITIGVANRTRYSDNTTIHSITEALENLNLLVLD